jgi:hypothetical protein
MKIKVLTAGKAILALGVCGLVAGVAAAQTTPSSQASAAARPRAHPAGAADAPFGAMRPPTFEQLDANHDGVVSKAEFDAWRAAHPIVGRPMPDGAPGDDIRGPGGWEGGMPHEMMWRHMRGMEDHRGPRLDLAAADTDHDGKISWAEFQAAAAAHLKAHFDELDANHDGFIEKDELPGRGHHHRHYEGRDEKATAIPAPSMPAK